jgi:NAD(P)-dependent dehydrogenase (short-subunit alcohol dehydrogenase family)
MTENGKEPRIVKDRWTTDRMPDLKGKTAIVTGANSGLGFHTARALAGKGAHVILACRNQEAGKMAAEKIRDEFPGSSQEVLALDLADLASVRSFADTFLQRHQALHILCNNAGVMATPFRHTVDGFELQFGTNHLGHFALTGLLVQRILDTHQSRVVTVSSDMHRFARLSFVDSADQPSYSRWGAYSQSKLANLLFAYELQRRFEAIGAAARSVGAHPGYAATNLQSSGLRMGGARVLAWIMKISNRLFAQSPEMGALPTLYAATAPDVQGGDFVGPDGLRGNRGYPKKVRSSQASYNLDAARKLWATSASLTGVRYAALSR